MNDIKVILDDGEISYGQLAVGTVTTGEAGTEATVTNKGTSSRAILDFTIPRGEKGEKGDTGEQGIQGIQGIAGKDGKDGKDGADGKTPTKGVDYFTEQDIEEFKKEASGIIELTENFNVWELESGIYYVAPNVTMTNYTMYYSNVGTAVGITESESMSTITVQLAKAFLIVHNYYEGMGMVEFHLFMMGEAPAVLSGATMYQEGISMGVAITGGDFVLLQKLLNKQDKLVSGTNIKTINNTSLLGKGDISVATTSYVDSKVGDIESLLSEV